LLYTLFGWLVIPKCHHCSHFRLDVKHNLSGHKAFKEAYTLICELNVAETTAPVEPRNFTALADQEKKKANLFARTFEAIVNWPLLRKVETSVFGAMFIALPFFALRVVDHATTTLAVKNTSVDLVNDLIRCKGLAKQHQVNITLTSRTSTDKAPGAYEIKDEEKTVEEVLLPKGVNIIGSVTFDPQGLPLHASSFIVSKGIRSAHVDVNTQGDIAVP
jgi:hypothetical protein